MKPCRNEQTVVCTLVIEMVFHFVIQYKIRVGLSVR